MNRKMNAQQQQWYQYAMQRAQDMGHPYPEAFANKLMQESSFNPSAVSKAGAQGIAQFMPATAAAMGLKNPFDPHESIDASVRYDLQNAATLHAHGIDPSVQNLMAAYNAGPQAVIKHGGVPNYAETTDYVKQITGGAPVGSPAASYGGQPYGNAGGTTTAYAPVPAPQQYIPDKQPNYANTLSGTVAAASPITLSQFYNGQMGKMYGG